ncbi:MAG: hypothetical protein IPL40_02510 [Proteobacteria bacterium]|nr:hypothetical protein [Pseudomonadota bacterium]
MRTPWHELWGCARGPIMGLTPPVRLLASGATFAACMVAPTTNAGGVLLIALATTGWLLACKPPLALVQRAVTLTLLLWLPVALLLPLLPPGAAGLKGRAPLELLLGLGGLLLRGLGALLIATGAVASLPPSGLREALLRLPLPRLVVAILLQIVQHTGSLLAETQRVRAALALRGAFSGAQSGWRLLRALPQVWLPRVIVRADRIADAMELRSYGWTALQPARSTPFVAREVAALILALSLLVVAAALRLRAWGMT